MVSSDIKGILRKVLCVLKREELGEVVKKWGVFGEESIREVTHLANSVGRTVPRKSITEKIVQECVKQKISNKQISELDLLCSIRHPEKKKWCVYELKGLSEDHSKKAFDPQVYFDKFTKHISVYFKHDLCMDKRGEAIWLRIGIYDSGKDSAYFFSSNTIYVVYYPHSRHLIVSVRKKGLMQFVMQALILSLGCTSCKETKLTGYHLDSLADLTLNPASQGWFSKFRHNQVDTNPLVKTQTRKRRGDSLDLEDKSLISENVEDEEKCQKDLDSSFGTNKQPKLERIVYEMENKFRGTRAAPRMATRQEPFRCVVKFEGPNVLEGLRQLHPSGISSTALPYLFEQVLSTGKNHFRIYDKSSRDRTGS
ncbi:centromere protein N [Strongylocentrotus purpuratus]|uniref:Centromere protein N n=1 Tax=Strongylocentrotus purpuratus TaxID=7668 RepID=A0A7M7N4X1_STRPU|nr:centromere protein N [Strongylocentrotus purpuratus]